MSRSIGVADTGKMVIIRMFNKETPGHALHRRGDALREERMRNGRDWLSVREAAEHAGVSQGAIRYWIGNKRLQALAIDGRYQAVDAGELSRFLAARRAAASVGINVTTLMQWVEEAAP